MPGIIVGIEAADHSRAALRWAIHEAERRHAPLTVMAVHPGPVRPATQVYWPVPDYPEDGSGQEAARKAIGDFVEKLAGEIGAARPALTVSVLTGDPAAELIAASREAELLVVGSHGSGELGRLLTGSVSDKVALHAGCPVVIVPATS